MENILAQGSWWPINQLFTEVFGIDASLMLAYLVSCQQYWDTKKDETGDFFFCTKEVIEHKTSITPYRQTIALKILTDLKVVESKRAGVPAKLLYRINNKAVNKIITELYSK